MNIKLNKAQKIQVLNSDDIYDIMREILMRENKIDRSKEHFWLVCLSASNHILMIELISMGSSKATVVDPVDVFSFALQKKAAKLLMVHNHPSGNVDPSQADVDLTERMHAIGHFLGLPVIDHLIISPKDRFSFKDRKLMDIIAREKRYDLTFSELDKLTAQLKKVQKEKDALTKTNESLLKKQDEALKQRAKEMAKSLLDQGVAIEIIVAASGLTKRQVEGLRKEM